MKIRWGIFHENTKKDSLMKMATDLNYSPSVGVARMGHEGKSGIDRATLIPVDVWWWRCLGFLNEIIYFHYLTVCLFDDKFFYPEACFVFTAWVEKIDTHLMRCFINFLHLIRCLLSIFLYQIRSFYQFLAPNKMFFPITIPITLNSLITYWHPQQCIRPLSTDKTGENDHWCCIWKQEC